MLSISLRSSWLLLAALCVMHGLGGLAVFLTPFPLAAKFGIAAVILSSLIHACARHVWPVHAGAICGLRLQGECELSVQMKDGIWLPAMLLPRSFVSPYLAVLNLSVEEYRQPRHVVILPDAIDAEQFRQLRIWLRWKCTRAEQASS